MPATRAPGCCVTATVLVLGLVLTWILVSSMTPAVSGTDVDQQPVSARSRSSCPLSSTPCADIDPSRVVADTEGVLQCDTSVAASWTDSDLPGASPSGDGEGGPRWVNPCQAGPPVAAATQAVLRLPDMVSLYSHHKSATHLLPSQFVAEASGVGQALIRGTNAGPIHRVVLVGDSLQARILTTVLLRSFRVLPFLRVLHASDVADATRQLQRLGGQHWLLAGRFSRDERRLLDAASLEQGVNMASMGSAFSVPKHVLARRAAALAFDVDKPVDEMGVALGTQALVRTSLAAAEWYHAGVALQRVRRVVVTGAKTGGFKVSEAAQMAVILLSRGVPAHAIILETKARSTGTNAVYSLQQIHAYLDAQAESDPAFGGSARHARRAVPLTLIGRREHLTWAIPLFEKHSAEFHGMRYVATQLSQAELEAQMFTFAEEKRLKPSSAVVQRLKNVRAGVQGID